MSCFKIFKEYNQQVELPSKFDFPFNYQPHDIAKLAAQELQIDLLENIDFKHNFGINNSKQDALGKMFGVLVVKRQKDNTIGYLRGFSGMIGGKQIVRGFVPPIFNRMNKDEFFKTKEQELNLLNKSIKNLQNISQVDSSKKKSNIEEKIVYLKTKRKAKSANLQQLLFKEYNITNQNCIDKNIIDIFQEYHAKNPPSGAGDCVAPKLLQYAFKKGLDPICMAEFWWGISPPLKIRKHTYFYPACKSKCRPILEYMLKGIKTNKNPIQTKIFKNKKIEKIYEDDCLLIINKPHDFLSVPGKEIKDSVESRLRKEYLNDNDPIIVHRLDMSTSGLMIIAKNKKTHKYLQDEFLYKKIQKRYIAILDGEIKNKHGFINLPIRVDLDNRPSQMVCYKHGKSSYTKWEVIEIKNQKTKVYLYPITGRTHQLRVHMAHYDGLNTPIMGDEIYGKKSQRLYLHANRIIFTHPVSKQKVQYESPCLF